MHTVAAWSTYGCRCDSLNRKKDANTLEILDRTYRDVNVLFVQAHCIEYCARHFARAAFECSTLRAHTRAVHVQEAAAVFVAKANAASLGRSYAVVSSSSLDGKHD